jgi:hypothetical protein
MKHPERKENEDEIRNLRPGNGKADRQHSENNKGRRKDGDVDP